MKYELKCDVQKKKNRRDNNMKVMQLKDCWSY